MHINFALIAAITAILHGTVALPVARLPPQAQHLEKRSYLPTWVALMLTLVIFNNRANILNSDDKVEKLQQQVAKILKDEETDQLEEPKFQGSNAISGSIEIGEEQVAKKGKKLAAVPEEGEEEGDGAYEVETDHDWWLNMSDA